MRVAICDDEKIFQEQLKNELDQYFHSLDIWVDCYGRGEELLANYENKQYDIVFLDIEMDGLDGLQVAREMHHLNRDLPIIMVTTHTELALEGYEVQAFRFLAKPIDRKKLHSALQAVEAVLHDDEKLCIASDGVQRYLPFKSVCYVKCENVYLNIITTNDRYLVRQKLKELMKQLPANLFVQVHRSYMVNLRYVVSFNGTTIYMEDGAEIPVSKANKELFSTCIIHYMKGKR